MLFPAHAGVIHGSFMISAIEATFPRTRGGDPGIVNFCRYNGHFSPHTRG